MSSPQFFTIQQIDNIKGILTPHHRDLQDMGKKHIEVFKNLTEDDLNSLISKVEAKIDHLDFGETWTLTKEFFPEVKLHVLLQFDDEFGGEPYELQFLFSGERITWLSGEDLCHLVEIFLNYTSSMITGNLPQDIYTGTISPLVTKAMKERTIDWTKIPMDKELYHYFQFSPFPGFTIEYDSASTPMGFNIKCDKLHEFWIYDVDRLIIMGLNQVLRLVKIRMGTEAPSICNAMFSGYYKKANPDSFP
jgi:hypothetical protein